MFTVSKHFYFYYNHFLCIIIDEPVREIAKIKI